ncbi:LysR substrate-binding domain-containing protein [Marinobacter confluentis]|uniref:LysR family transcriptional regulator n=1 Tax=Marinobacter confluentis TaxID=1697557 RepID=A0A4Z1C594_9GAMM|nr:LysR substrate-binding domain-containing protein [Marinobacter confluentis]TGN40450.1 LysR family transcriptional regulator [Marinobacter confluentis]
MNYRRTPPIKYIPIFEAAARHLSFKKAAEELCVTAPAVGQQIKAFEEWLGKPLFQRSARQLSLSAEGECYFRAAQAIMTAHKKGYIEFSRRFDKSVLHISAPLFTVQEVLLPNYLRFNDYASATELRIEARMSYVDFDAERVDAAIRLGDGNWPELHCRKLCEAFVAPVCSPSYAASHEFTKPGDLSQHRLIYAEPAMNDWGHYFGVNDFQPQNKPIICDSYLGALKAASDGLGVALAIFPTANTWVDSNRIVLPFPVQYRTGRSYWMVVPESDHSLPQIDAVYGWLQSIFDELPALKQTVATIALESF